MQRLSFVFLLAVMWCLPGLSVGKAPSIAELKGKIDQTAGSARQSPKIEKNTVALSFDPKQVIKALDGVRFKQDDLPLINNYMTYSDFMAENDEIRTSLQQISLATDIDPEMESKIEILGIKGRPDYGEAAKSVRFLYLSESSHRKRTVVNEVKRILHSVREKNPQAKILLATEFGQATHLSTPIRFAKTDNKNIEWGTPYSQLLEETDRLDIDILALDDSFFIRETDNKNLWYKIGKYFVLLNENDRPAFITDPINITAEELYSLSGVVKGSSYGVQLRNNQWADYIKAIKKYYDIVIVYGGRAHFLSAPKWRKGVPEKINEKYILFNLYSSEETPQAQKNFEREHHARRHEKYCETAGCSTIVEDVFGINPQWDKENVMHFMVENPLTGKDKHIQSLFSRLKKAFPFIYQKERVKFFEVLLPDESGNN